MKLFDLNGKLISKAEDALYEMGNVGVSTAIVPIGNIRKMEFRIGIPQVFGVEEDIFSQIEYSPDEIVIAVKTKMDKKADGSILFLLSLPFVHNTVETMLGEKIKEDQLIVNEDSISIIEELINYMSAGYVKVMGAYLDIPMFISAAVIGMESVRDIIEHTINEMNKTEGKAVCVNTKFFVADSDGNKTNEEGQILIFPEKASIEGMIKVVENTDR